MGGLSIILMAYSAPEDSWVDLNIIVTPFSQYDEGH